MGREPGILSNEGRSWEFRRAKSSLSARRQARIGQKPWSGMASLEIRDCACNQHGSVDLPMLRAAIELVDIPIDTMLTSLGERPADSSRKLRNW